MLLAVSLFDLTYNLYCNRSLCFLLFFFNDTATTEIYTLSLHDALPICEMIEMYSGPLVSPVPCNPPRSEEHTSELQSQFHLVCRLLLEKKKKQNKEVYCKKKKNNIKTKKNKIKTK